MGARVGDRRLHRLDDVRVGRRVGVADPEADHVDPGLALVGDLALELGEHVGRDRLEPLRWVGERHRARVPGAGRWPPSASWSRARRAARRRDELGEQPAVDREAAVRVSPGRARSTSTSSSPPSSSTVIGLGAPREEGGDRGPAGAGARGERLPHPALEDPRPHPRPVDADEGDVGAVREQLVGLDRGTDRGEVEPLELVADLDHALRVADVDVLEGPLAPRRLEGAGAVRRARGIVGRGQSRRGPIAIETSFPVIVGVSSPALVTIVNVSRSVQPAARR